MIDVISVRFKEKGKIYFFDPNGVVARSGENVIVETSKGLEFAECTQGNHAVEDTTVIPPLRPVIRIATPEDERRMQINKAKEREAFEYCQARIDKLGLDMKLIDVEHGFDGSKILFFFTSDGRVDFRELVKDLATMFKTRIELRQIGVRDEARMLGGLGICGRPFCCSQFLDEFHPVSIKMAKTQGLSLNPTKISGTCGRLMCCLKYEQDAYEDLVKNAPKADSFVETPAGKGSITGINLLRGYAKVRLEDGNDTTLKTYSFDELEVLGGKARRAEYIAAKAEGKLEEAGFEEKPASRSSIKDMLEPVERPERSKDGKKQNKKQNDQRQKNQKKNQNAPGGQTKQEAPKQNEKKEQPKHHGGDKNHNEQKPDKPAENTEPKEKRRRSHHSFHNKPQTETENNNSTIKEIAAEAARDAAKKSSGHRNRNRYRKPKQNNGDNRQDQDKPQ